MKRLIIIGTLFAQGLLASAQSPSILVEMEQSIDSAVMMVDIFVQKISGPDIPLGNTNFAFTINDQALDLATKSKWYEGPFDNQMNGASYSDMLLQGTEIVNLTVRKNVAGSGSGVMINANRTKVATLLIPITNSCTTSTQSWITDRGAFSNFSSQSIRAQVQFQNPAPNFPLCMKPAAPALLSSTLLELCPTDSVLASVQGSGDVAWYAAQDSSFLGNTAQIWLHQPGNYYAASINCFCKSDPVAITVLPAEVPQAPQVLQNGNILFANVIGNYPLQWFLNGTPLSGDTLLSVQANAPGFYKAGHLGSCGWVYSDSIAYNVSSFKDLELVDDLQVFPNPFQDHTQAFLTLSQGSKVLLEIVDARGVVWKVVEQQPYKEPGQYTIPLDLRGIDASAGTYFLRASYRNMNKMIKLVAK